MADAKRTAGKRKRGIKGESAPSLSPQAGRRFRRHSVIDHLSRALGEDWVKNGVPQGPRAQEIARIILEEASVYRRDWALKEVLRLEETVERIYNGLKLNIAMPQLDALMEMIVAVVCRYVKREEDRLAIATELTEIVRRATGGTRTVAGELGTRLGEEAHAND